MKYRLLRAIVLLFCLICTVEGWAQIETYSSFIVDEIGYQILPNRDREVAVVNSAQEYVVVGAGSRSSVRKVASSGYVYRKLNYSGDVTIPTTVTYDGTTYTVKKIADKAFSGCSNLTSVNLPAKLDSIGKEAFYNCKLLYQLVIPSSTSFIEIGAFSGCTGLKKVTLEEGDDLLLFALNFGSMLFNDSPIDTLYLGRHLSYVDNDYHRSPFKKVKHVIVCDNITTLCDQEFNGCTLMESVVLGKNVSKIGTAAFSGCSALERVDARSEKLKVIPERAFQDCRSLSTFFFPTQLDSIGENAFKGCKAFVSLTIPGSVRCIGTSAFCECNGLKNLKFEEGTEPLKLMNEGTSPSFGNSPIDTLYLGRDIIFSTASKFFSQVKNVIIGDNVTTLCDKEFNGCTLMESVVFGKNVSQIGTAAFSGCWALERVDARSEKLKVIPDEAFQSCRSLNTFYFPTQLDSIGKFAFDECNSLTSLTIPGSVCSIGNRAFSRCPGLKYLKFEEGTEPLKLMNEGSYPSFGNSPIDTLYLGRDIVYLTASKFFSQVKNVIVSDNVTTLCDKEFNGCTLMESVVFGKNVSQIGTAAFSGCWALERVDARSEKLKVIPDEAFQSCRSLNIFYFPAQLDSIGEFAFDECTSLTSLTIPNSVRCMGNRAFSRCSGLKYLNFEEGTEPLYIMRQGSYPSFDGAHIDTLYLGRNIVFPDASFSFRYVKNVILCSNLTSLCENVFYNTRDPELEKIFVPWRTPFEINSNVFSDNTYKTATLVIPKGTMNAYQNTEAWKRFLNIEEEVGTQVEQTLELAELPAMTYGDTAYTLPEETTEGQALTWASSNTAVATVTGHQIEIKKAGTAIITATQEGNDDYLPFSREFTLTIAKAALKITADNQTREQGQDNPTLTVKYEGFKYSDNASSLTTQPTVSTTATKDSPVGSYPITASGANSDNYTISYVNGTLTITEATLPQDVTDISQLADAIYIEPLTALIGSDQDIEVRMKNAEKATSYGFTLVLPEGMTISTSGDGSFDEAVTLSSRNSNHGVTTNKLADNTYKIGVASLSSKSLTGNDGLVLTIKAHVQESMAAGTYPILVKSPLIVYSDGTKPSMQETRTLVTVEDYQKGDVDGDGVVDLADAVLIINHYVGKPSVVFIEKVADVDGDGVIDLADAVRIINFYVGRIPSLSRDNAGEHDPQ